MVAPEWFNSNTTAARTRPAVQAPATPPVLPHNDPPTPSPGTPGTRAHGAGGFVAGGSHACGALRAMSAAVVDRCATFFDPVVLAQLDAALAHEFAHQAATRLEDAGQVMDQAIREGSGAQTLAHLAHQSASAKAVASKATSQAALATAVIDSLGGTATNRGFDPEIIEQLCGASLIDAIASLEEVKNTITAVQAQAQALFLAQQRLSQAKAGVPQEKLGQGIAQQVGLARHESPYRGRYLCGLSEVLVREMPYSMNAFLTGKISEYRASLIVKETAFLSLADRARVDQLISSDPDALALLGTRELSAASKKAAYALDPQAFLKRHQKALSDRYVSLRPAPDGMTFLTALIPLKQGVRILATLTRVAASAKASGDERGKGQIMADALMHRLTHHAPCDAGARTLSDHRGTPSDHRGTPTGADHAAASKHTRSTGEDQHQPVRNGDGRATQEPWCTTVNEPEISLELIMTDRALFSSTNDPAVLLGYEPIPAPLAREMILGSKNNRDAANDANDGDGSGGARDRFRPRVWLKRLFTHPESNALLAMDSRARLFPEGMKEFLRVRDQHCQTPYCDAPIREYDHIKAYAAGGPTTLENGQSLCTACNQAKEAPGWSSHHHNQPHTGQPHTEINTPTGHHYISTAPPLPGPTKNKPHHKTNQRN